MASLIDALPLFDDVAVNDAETAHLSSLLVTSG
jgi:hypothetical protein